RRGPLAARLRRGVPRAARAGAALPRRAVPGSARKALPGRAAQARAGGEEQDRLPLPGVMSRSGRPWYPPGMQGSMGASETEQVPFPLPGPVVRGAAANIADIVRAAAADVAVAVEALDDATLLALCDLRSTPTEQAELSALLWDNREGLLQEAGRARL